MGIDSTYYQYTTVGCLLFCSCPFQSVLYINDRKLTLHTSDHQTGWMMWNMLIGALSLGSRVILYDGSPLHPTPSFQLSLLESQGYVRLHLIHPVIEYCIQSTDSRLKGNSLGHEPKIPRRAQKRPREQSNFKTPGEPPKRPGIRLSPQY
jgi:acyl-coenzyme A synthetase/AMP-(fatty) acid ligase